MHLPRFRTVTPNTSALSCALGSRTLNIANLHRFRQQRRHGTFHSRLFTPNRATKTRLLDWSPALLIKPSHTAHSAAFKCPCSTLKGTLELDTVQRYEIRSPHMTVGTYPRRRLSDQQPRYRSLAFQIFTLGFIIRYRPVEILCKIPSRILDLTNALIARTHRRRIVPPHPFGLRIGGAKSAGRTQPQCPWQPQLPTFYANSRCQPAIRQLWI